MADNYATIHLDSSSVYVTSSSTAPVYADFGKEIVYWADQYAASGLRTFLYEPESVEFEMEFIPDTMSDETPELDEYIESLRGHRESEESDQNKDRHIKNYFTDVSSGRRACRHFGLQGRY